jgi:hypothetical protein
VLAELRAQTRGLRGEHGHGGHVDAPTGDPFHERLVAAYPQIRRFLPGSIETVELQAIDSAALVLAAYHALGKWLIDKPRTTRRRAEEVPLEVAHGRRGGPTRTTSRPAPSTAAPTPAVCSLSGVSAAGRR